MGRHILALTATALMLAGCATPPQTNKGFASLIDTGWQLVEIQSSGGAVRPADPIKYQIFLLGDGQLSLKLDCNRGTGKWTYAPVGNNQGSFTLSPVAMTRAACPAGSLEAQIARDVPRIRSYAMTGNRLDLALDSNGGTYSWQRIPE